MTRLPALLGRGIAATLVCAGVAGCAGIGATAPSEDGPGSVRTPTGERLAPQAAMERIAIGRSSKAEVSAALGKAIVVRFDNGHEVWVYRWPGPDGTTRSSTELVVLFDPAGMAKKLRLRPGYPPPVHATRSPARGRPVGVRRRAPGA